MLYGRVLRCCLDITRWLFFCLFVFSFVKSLFFSWATEIQWGAKPVRKRCPSSLQISLESCNSPMLEKLSFPWMSLCCHTPPEWWVTSICLVKLWASSRVSRGRQKLLPVRSAALVREPGTSPVLIRKKIAQDTK